MKNIYKRLKVGDHINNLELENDNLICYSNNAGEFTLICITNELYDKSVDDLNKYLRIDVVLQTNDKVRFRVYLPSNGWASETISLNLGDILKGDLKDVLKNLTFNFIVIHNTSAKVTHKLKCVPDYTSKQRLLNALQSENDNNTYISVYPNFSAINFGYNPK